MLFLSDMHTHTHKHTYSHILIHTPLVRWPKHIFSPLFKTSPLFPIFPDSTKWAYIFDWQPQQTPSPPPPLHPRFNPLPIPLPLPLLFLFCSEWRSKAAVSASFPSLIALLAGGGTRSFSDTDGEGGGSSRGEKKMADLCLLLLLFPPTSSWACMHGHWHLRLTLTHSWHWCLSRQHTVDGREILEFSVVVLSLCECVFVFVVLSGLSLSAELLCL